MWNMQTTQKDFGQFVAGRRRASGLTQRDLAIRLHVTESAVSKWERGLSYPDITVVPALARTLGVSGDELMSPSEDHEARFERHDARSYRAWRSSILRSTSIAYGAAVLAAFIVNLSASHALSWFWVVLTAVALAFSLTTLPLLRVPAGGWIVLGASVLSLFALFGTAALIAGTGAWVPIAVSAVLFAIIVVFGPVWLYRSSLPQPFGRHLTVIALLIDTIALALLLLVIMISIGRIDLWVSPGLVIVAIGAVPAWVMAMMIRYLPLRAAFVAALVLVAIGMLLDQ